MMEMAGSFWRRGVGVGGVAAALTLGCSPAVDLGSTGDSGGHAPDDDSGTKSSGDGPSGADSKGGADAASSPPGKGDSETETGAGFTLTVTFTGFDYPVPPDGGETVLHTDVYDLTADPNTTLCAGGSSLGAGFTKGTYEYGPSVAAPGLILGHSYSFGYAINGDNFVGCVAGDPNADGSAYHYQLFGPVTGDVSLTATPSDPTME
jgi:hypothetical protein